MPKEFQGETMKTEANKCVGRTQNKVSAPTFKIFVKQGF